VTWGESGESTRLLRMAAAAAGMEEASVMITDELIGAIDHEIARLQQASSLLRGSGGGVPSPFASRISRKRVLSAEARERIAAAQRKRWAKQKKMPKS
jgi:hypothetical protein